MIEEKLHDLENKFNLRYNNMISKKTLCMDKFSRLQELTKNISNLQGSLDLFKKTNNFLSKFSSSLRESVALKIEKLVTSILHEVLQNTRYDFKIIFSQKRNVVDAAFVLYDNLNKVNVDILQSSGGGIADIVSAILFFAFLEISNTKSDFVILDEVGKHLSADKRDKFFDLLKMLSKDYNKQILYVSHQSEILEKADTIIKIGLDDSGNSIII